MRDSRCHGVQHTENQGLNLPWLCAELKESPPPLPMALRLTWLFSTSANPLFLFESSQIPYCPHGCGALHPVQAEGTQQGERGRCKQQQKQLRVSRRDERKSKLGSLLTTTVTLQKDRHEMEDCSEAPGTCRGREPLPEGPLWWAVWLKRVRFDHGN